MFGNKNSHSNSKYSIYFWSRARHNFHIVVLAVVARLWHMIPVAFTCCSPKSALLPARSPVVEARCRLLGYVFAHSNALTWSQETELDRGDETPLSACAYHTLRAHCSQPSPKNAVTIKGEYKGEGAMQPHPSDVLLLYYDDVSSGPRPRAHWYMLTDQCCSDTAPYWTPHRAAQSSGPYPRPLQRLSTNNHQVQSLSIKYRS